MNPRSSLNKRFHLLLVHRNRFRFVAGTRHSISSTESFGSSGNVVIDLSSAQLGFCFPLSFFFTNNIYLNIFRKANLTNLPLNSRNPFILF
ncbi:unnamed protein product [Arabidopsis halleri]